MNNSDDSESNDSYAERFTYSQVAVIFTMYYKRNCNPHKDVSLIYTRRFFSWYKQNFSFSNGKSTVLTETLSKAGSVGTNYMYIIAHGQS